MPGYCILIKKMKDIEAEPEHSHNVLTDEAAKNLPGSSFATQLMNSPEFLNYIQHHGYHFTDRLADYASRLMVNANGEKHKWTSEQVAKALEPLRDKMPSYITNGDLAYAANMCYADFLPAFAKTEEDCLKYANLVAKDPDGYNGMIFNRWLSDVIHKEMKIDWGLVI